MISIQKMIQDSPIKLDTQNMIKDIFGDDIFSDSLYLITEHELDNLAMANYHTWCYGNVEDIDFNGDDSPVLYMLHKGFIKNYKDLDFIRTRWSLNEGLNLGDTITIKKDGTSNTDEEKTKTDTSTSNDTGTITDNTTSVMVGETTTDNDFSGVRTDDLTSTTNSTSTSSSTSDSTSSVKTQSENAPLGAVLGDITTPYEKGVNSTENSTNTETDGESTGTIKNTGTVKNVDNSTSVTSDNADTSIDSTRTLNTQNQTDREGTESVSKDNEYVDNATAVRKYGIEELSAIKTSGVNIMQIIENIVDIIVYEYNTLI